MSTERIELVAATANPDKLAEIEAILGEAGITLSPRPPDVPDVDETGDTLLENARLKARALADATGRPAVADDTGLAVDALDGAPGVWSARYAGEHATYVDNVNKLVAALADIPDGDGRGAGFSTVALVAWPDGSELWREGTVRGRIVLEPSGENGFGYDSVFVPDDGDGRTYAELSAEEKHALSHRGRAFRALAAALAESG